MTAHVVFVDTETLGLHPDRNPVWEIGLILPDGSEHCWQVQVSDCDIAAAEPIALQISGFDDRYDADSAIGRNQTARMLHTLIPDRAHLCGAVVSFDEERLRRLMEAEGFAHHWHYHLIEVETLAAGALAQWAATDDSAHRFSLPWKSEQLSMAVGVDPGRFERHTALGDARWAKAVYEAVMTPAGIPITPKR